MVKLFLIYIDPGAGSMLVQVTIAGILGFLYTFRTYWLRILNFFKQKGEKISNDKKIGNKINNI